MKRFILASAVIAAIMLCSNGVASAGGQTREYEITPVSSDYSGRGWIRVQVAGPVREQKGGQEFYWWQLIDGSIGFPEDGRYYVYFDPVPMYTFNCGWDNHVLDCTAIIVTYKKVSFPKAIYVYDADGSLVYRSN